MQTMTEFNDFLEKTHHNLQILQEREAKYGGNAPLDLLNQIDDHQTAILLTEQAREGHLSAAAWREALKPLLLTINQQGQTIQGDQYNAGRDQHFHFYQIEKRLDPENQGRCDFYGHVQMPDNYVPRPEFLARIREALLFADNDSLALTSDIKTQSTRPGVNALHGMGGIGKTVLARAVCDDADIQAAFPDGILWATLGQTPDLTAHLREWVGALGGTISENAPTVDTLKNNLSRLLQKRRCLLIVDDVWKRGHGEAFQVSAPLCRFLVTTRDAVIAEDLGAKPVSITTMAKKEATTLLEAWAGGNLRPSDADLAGQIVKRLGYHPLAIKLAGSQLRRQEPARWLETFDIRKLKERREETIHDNLALTFALSLDDLDGADRYLYTTLAIFKEDEAIPLVAVEKLWGALGQLDEDTVRELAFDLADRALLQLNQQVQADDQAHPSLVLHDLLRDFVSVELGETGRQQAHQAILAAYRRSQTGPGWPTAPDDGYLYDHLAYHLHALRVQGETDLKTLFRDDRWLHARVSQSGYIYDGYLADMGLAWEWARVQIEHHIETQSFNQALADCIHYALIQTSVNRLAANYVPALVLRAVETGLWSPERAVQLAIRIPEATAKAAMFAAISKSQPLKQPTYRRLNEICQRLGLEAALAIGDERDRAWALTALAPQLEGEAKRQALQQGLEAALALGSEGARAWNLSVLAPQLGGALLEQGLEVALALGDERDRAKALTALAPQLAGEAKSHVLQQGLEAALALGDERDRA